MSQPLGKYVGNAVEVYECIRILKGDEDEAMRPSREMSLYLAARALVLCGIADSPASAARLAESKLNGGEAFELFRQNCELQGGDTAVCDDPDRLIESGLESFAIKAEFSGYLAEADAKAIGEAVVEIGGGRSRVEDSIDPAVGYACEASVGDQLKAGDTLGVLSCRDESQFLSVREKLGSAYKISEEYVPRPDMIVTVV
jgi:thymidine phosphorylase